MLIVLMLDQQLKQSVRQKMMILLHSLHQRQIVEVLESCYYVVEVGGLLGEQWWFEKLIFAFLSGGVLNGVT